MSVRGERRTAQRRLSARTQPPSLRRELPRPRRPARSSGRDAAAGRGAPGQLLEPPPHGTRLPLTPSSAPAHGAGSPPAHASPSPQAPFLSESQARAGSLWPAALARSWRDTCSGAALLCRGPESHGRGTSQGVGPERAVRLWPTSSDSEPPPGSILCPGSIFSVAAGWGVILGSERDRREACGDRTLWPRDPRAYRANGCRATPRGGGSPSQGFPCSCPHLGRALPDTAAPRWVTPS